MLRTDFEKQTEEEERGLKSDPFSVLMVNCQNAKVVSFHA